MPKIINRSANIGSSTPNMAGFKDLMERLGASFGQHVLYGLVVKRDGEDSHFQITSDDTAGEDVYVEVDLMPLQTPVTARLGSHGGDGEGGGLWKIPDPGTEVMVLLPDGAIENGAVIIGCLSTQFVPDQLDEHTMVLTNPGGDIYIQAGSDGKTTILISGDGDVTITSDKATLSVKRSGDISATAGDDGATNLSLQNNGDASVTSGDNNITLSRGGDVTITVATGTNVNLGGEGGQQVALKSDLVALAAAISAATYAPGPGNPTTLVFAPPSDYGSKTVKAIP